MEKLTNKFSEENKEQFAPILELWAKKDGVSLSPLALWDFGKFLMQRSEYRNGDMTIFQPISEMPLEVIFFPDDPNSGDNVYQISQNFKKSVFEVKKLKGQADKITPLLEEFGLTLSSKE